MTGAGEEEATLLRRFGDLTHSQRRMDLDLRRLDLDVQRMDATVQLMGTSVGVLSEEVRQLGAYVRQLETKLDLSRRLMDFHLHTVMTHIGVPLVDTLHSSYRDREPTGDGVSQAPRQAGDELEPAVDRAVFEGAAVEGDPLGEPG